MKYQKFIQPIWIILGLVLIALSPMIARPVAAVDDFTVVVLPDTQYYSQSRPDIFKTQTQWIVDNLEDQNIVYVAHEGDLVQTHNDTVQWDRADAAMRLLEEKVTPEFPHGIPYGVVPGNHDEEKGSEYYNDYFGVDRFQGRPYYGGGYPDGCNDSNYTLFSASEMDFIVVNLDYENKGITTCQASAPDILNWADGLLKENSDRRAIVVSHSILGYPDKGHTGPRTAKSWDGSIQEAPLLHIEYTTSNSNETFEGRIASSSDDAEERHGGSMYIGSSDLEFMKDGSNVQRAVGMRWEDVNIPAGATITDAYIRFTTDEIHSQQADVVFFGQASADVLTFKGKQNDITSRPKTNNYVVWDNIPAWQTVGESGKKQRTPDLSGIIQEIVVDNGGCNSLVIIAHPLALFTSWGQEIYDELKDNPNLFLMLSGHNHAEGMRTDVYDIPNENKRSTVYTLLADYQDLPNGGDGWLRILEFSPDFNEIRVITYSPYLKKYGTDPFMWIDTTSAEFSLPYNMGRAPGDVIISGFQVWNRPNGQSPGEFVELFNTTDQPISLENMELISRVDNNSDGVLEVDWQLAENLTGKTIAPHSFFLIAESGVSAPSGLHDVETDLNLATGEGGAAERAIGLELIIDGMHSDHVLYGRHNGSTPTGEIPPGDIAFDGVSWPRAEVIRNTRGTSVFREGIVRRESASDLYAGYDVLGFYSDEDLLGDGNPNGVWTSPHDETFGSYEARNSLSPAVPPLDRALVAYYPFNGNADDESGNGNHGIVYGATPIIDRFGISPSAYSFDGVDDYVRIPDSDSLDITGDLTVSAWIKTPYDFNNNNNIIFSNMLEVSPHDGYSLRLWNEAWSGDMNAKVRFMSGGNLWDDTEINTDSWIHVAVTLSGRTARLYLDGVEKCSETVNIPTANTVDQTIGASYTPYYFFKGVIDDVAIYNRALSDDEIQELSTDRPN